MASPWPMQISNKRKLLPKPDLCSGYFVTQGPGKTGR